MWDGAGSNAKLRRGGSAGAGAGGKRHPKWVGRAAPPPQQRCPCASPTAREYTWLCGKGNGSLQVLLRQLEMER